VATIQFHGPGPDTSPHVAHLESGRLYPPDRLAEITELNPIFATERWHTVQPAVESNKEIHGGIDSAFVAALEERMLCSCGFSQLFFYGCLKKNKCTCLFGPGTSTLCMVQATAVSSLAAVWHQEGPKGMKKSRQETAIFGSNSHNNCSQQRAECAYAMC
jgi:hypothetical protein